MNGHLSATGKGAKLKKALEDAEPVLSFAEGEDAVDDEAGLPASTRKLFEEGRAAGALSARALGSAATVSVAVHDSLGGGGFRTGSVVVTASRATEEEAG